MIAARHPAPRNHGKIAPDRCNASNYNPDSIDALQVASCDLKLSQRENLIEVQHENLMEVHKRSDGYRG